MSETTFTPVPLVPDRRLMRTEPREASRESRRDASGTCGVCDEPATRYLGESRVCDAHYRHGCSLKNHGVTSPVGVMCELAGREKRTRGPDRSPRINAVPVTPPPPPTTMERLSLRDRLKARRQAAGGNERA